MSKITSYKELDIWAKSIQLVKEVYKVTNSFPDSEKFGLTSQIRRCTISIPSNIAEGWGRNKRRSFAHFLSISRGSLFELEAQICIAKELNFISNGNETIDSLIFELNKMISSLVTNIERSLDSKDESSNF